MGGSAKHTEILERIAVDAPLGGTLDEIVSFVEEQIPGAVGSCLLLDADGVHLHAASCGGLPAPYNAAIEGIAIGPGVGSCGAAAATQQAVWVEDIATHPNWAAFRELAATHRLAACWSTPIRARRRADGPPVLGTFAVYFHAPRTPTDAERSALARAEHLACIAIEADRAVHRIRDEESRFRVFIDHAMDAFFVHRQDGRVDDVSRQACESLGYAREELIGALPSLYDTDATPEHSSALLRRLDAGERVTFETRHRRKTGSVFPVEVQARSFEHRGRTLYLAVARDITERRKLEEQLRQVQTMDAIGRLAGGVAHDFNNVLTIIHSCAEMLVDELPEGSSAREDAQAIRQAGQRASTLTAQLLAFGRRSIVDPRPLDLNAAVQRLASMFDRLLGGKVTVETQLAPGLDPVLADATQIEQVLLNLVVNARDAMPAGGRLTISTANVAHEASAQGPQGRAVELVVSDDGIGMSDEVAARVFEPFFTTKGAGRGAGLGLATVYGIVAQAGGSIRVESKPGQGARFVVRLPAIEPALHRSARTHDPSLSGTETILLVEDQADVRRVATRALEVHGYRVLTAVDGENALAVERSFEGTIHLVVTDVVMPGIGGRAVVDAILARRPDVRVVYMSGYTDDEVLRNGVSTARDAFVQKPFTPQILARRVREVLDAPAASRVEG